MKDHLPQLFYTLIAVIGGIARHLNGYIRGDVVSVKVPTLLAHGFISGFSGLMFAETALRIAPEWAYVAAGVGGYMGTQAIDMLVEQVKKRMK